MRNVLLASVGVEKIIQRSFALENKKVQGRGQRQKIIARTREKKQKGERKKAREKELRKKGKRAREKGQKSKRQRQKGKR